MVVIDFRNDRMSADEFDRRWQEILDTYGTTTREAIAKRDRAIALFLADSGWTQQEIAKRIGRPQGWVSRQTNFGQFLAVYSLHIVAEDRFYKLWRQTSHLDDTDARYVEVSRLLDEERDASSDRKKHGPWIVEGYADGHWHRADKMAEALDLTEKELAAAMALLTRPQGAWHAKGEQKMVGRGVMYRVFHKFNAVSPQEIKEKLVPFIDELKAEGKKTHIALASFQNVLALAIRIERQVEEWCKPPGPGAHGSSDGDDDV